jgi:serine/threonine-protein kinase
MIEHPSIVDIYELDELPDGRPYLVMEWIEGRNLDQELRARGRFAINEALPVLEDIAAALRAVHAASVVHRDLKASNVLTIPSEASLGIKLVDFGIAKLIDDSDGDGSTDARLGSPTNMAPEQVLDHAVDERADIYAFGVLTFQLITGQLPFHAPTIAELEEMHLRMPAPCASDIAPGSPAIDAMIHRCMAKSPDERYQTVDELVAALRGAMTVPAHTRCGLCNRDDVVG